MTAYKRTYKRLLSFLLALVLTVGMLPTVLLAPVSAASPSVNISNLNTWQQNYLRVIKSLALKDAYDTGILASITAGQAVYEGGWARYGISVIANNQYGIKANSNWEGKVFDSNTYMLYDSYEDFVRIKGASYAKTASIWRAYKNWDESVHDHSDLFLRYSRYEHVLTAKDYKEAAQALVSAGYTSDRGYVETLIKIIEDYGLDALDSVTADANGVVGMVMDQSKVTIPTDGTLNLTASAYPAPVLVTEGEESSDEEVSDETDTTVSDGENAENSDASGEETSDEHTESESTEPDVSEPEKIPFEIVWESNAPDVATVDQNGVVTAVSQGIALITATYNGKEAACLVCVGTNAFVVGSDVTVRSEADTKSASLGRVNRGMPIAVIGSQAEIAPDGTNFYKVRATSSTGELMTGYVVCDHVYLCTRQVSIINTKTELNLDVGTTYQTEVELAPADAEDKTLTWSSSDESIVSVDANGVLTTHAKGTATVRVTAASGIFVEITVGVGKTVTYRGIVTSNLNVRTEPNSDSRSLGMIAQGTEITLIGEPEGGWYYVKATIISGAEVEGYCYGTYIELPDAPQQPPIVEPIDPPISGDNDMPFENMEREREGVVEVSSTLKIRSDPGTKSSVVVQVGNGTPLLIIGDDITVDSEPTYKTWYYVQLQLDGKFYDGYAAADFITVMQENTAIPEPDTYTMTDMFILGIKPGTTLAALHNDINNRALVIGAVGNELLDWDIVATGDVVNYMIGTTVVKTRMAIVRGDVNGDAEVNAFDYMMVKRSVLGTYELGFFGEEAAKVSGSEGVTANDYMMVKRYVLGTFEL